MVSGNGRGPDDEMVIALTPAQLAAVLAGLVLLIVLLRSRRAR